jgi:hypothetical protein
LYWTKNSSNVAMSSLPVCKICAVCDICSVESKRMGPRGGLGKG